MTGEVLPGLVCDSCGRQEAAGHPAPCPHCGGVLLSPHEAELSAARRDGQRHLGRYLLLGKVGEGGMGEVWRAWDETLRRRVAIKLIRPALVTEESGRRLATEAQVLAQLEHPGIAPIYDAGEFGGRAFIVMKFVAGETLEKAFPQGTGEISRVVSVMRDAARAIGYAHRKGFVHRDIKPANIMLDEEERVVVMDFGLAKLLNEKRAHDDGMPVGTPAFMSPEQVAGREDLIDARSDVYGLGATLWTLLAGRNIFEADSLCGLLSMIELQNPPLLQTVRPGVTTELDSILSTAMSRNRDSRFASAVEFANALDRSLGVAARESTTYVFGAPVFDEAADAGADAPVSSRRAFVVDDDEDIARLVRALLEREGLEVVHFPDAESALANASSEAPALAILDGNLPGMSGPELLARLRAMPAWARIPIVMLTAQGGEQNVARGFHLGADDYIVKPFSPVEFSARVKRLFQRRS